MTATDSSARSAPRVALLVKDGCHLCEQAVETVRQVCSRLDEPWETVDGAERPDLLERHLEEVPVLFVDGVQRDFWRVDPARLERLLRG
ncbi:glutaredoxin family protein [Micrococcus cohnii]|uniref:Glutaredoxin family protein n=1 Tax=Micrococcus cohnii TaxID=993416 RepID=A0A7W7GP99_9MICC|nr:glutaredoxin family protein [Micrococcus cohnii]MBB4735818.1 hypothetical protein [Micrococcus cohnii]